MGDCVEVSVEEVVVRLDEAYKAAIQDSTDESSREVEESDSNCAVLGDAVVNREVDDEDEEVSLEDEDEKVLAEEGV